MFSGFFEKNKKNDLNKPTENGGKDKVQRKNNHHAHSDSNASIKVNPNRKPVNRDNKVAEEIPEYIRIISDKGDIFELSESLRRQMAVLELSDKTVCILYTDSVFQDNYYLTLKQRIKNSSYIIESEVKVVTGKLMTLYSENASSKTELKHKDDFLGSDNENFLNYIISHAVKMRATDIHLCPRYETVNDAVKGTGVILFRVDGKLKQWESFPAQEIVSIAGYMYTKKAEESSRSDPAFNPKQMQSCSIPIRLEKHHLKLRYQSVRANGGFDVILRLLFTDKESKVASLEQLGYSESQVKQLDLAVRKTVGGIFIAGVTGSGKSTTLKTLMSQSPTRLERKSYSIEDPVEYKIFGVTQIPVQRSSADKENSVNPFLESMRVILRSDPDTIMPGEIRDVDSCSMLKSMIQSGHQVMTSIHASSVIDIVERITSSELGLPRQSLASRTFISALIYQRLLPKICPECGVPASEVIDPHVFQILKDKFKVDTSKMRASIKTAHCKTCGGSGTHGVTVAAEIILPDLTFLKHIRNNEDMEAEEYWRKTRVKGYGSSDMTGKTAFEHGLYKVLAGICDIRDLEDGFEPLETYQTIEIRQDLYENAQVDPASKTLFSVIDLNDINDLDVSHLKYNEGQD